MPQLSYTLSEVATVARQLLEEFGLQTYALTGNLGAGKTTLVAALCRHLGVTEPTSSPTFSIVNEYQGTHGRIYHLDAYRLNSLEEALDAGLEEIFADESATVFVEWPAVIQPLLPSGVVTLHLAHAPDGAARHLTITRGYAPTDE